MKTLLMLTAAALIFTSSASASTEGQAAQASEATPAQMTVREHKKAQRLELQKERLETRRQAIKAKIEARARK